MPEKKPELPVKCYIGLGSNLGNRKAFLNRAISALQKYPEINIARKSSFYDTAPVGNENQRRFLNAVLEINTSLMPEKLLKAVMQIEYELGRKRTEHWGPRTIDIDILTYGDLVHESEHLSIPHPLLHERRFVLEPLAEIAPEFRHPVFGATPSEMLKVCYDL